MLAIGESPHHSNELKQSSAQDHSDRFVAKSCVENSNEKAEL